MELPPDFRDMPLQTFEVSEADFVDYDGVLQIGVPPLRIDIVNRIAGVSFDEVVAAGDSFELDGRRIAVIGRDPLIKNKRTVGRPRDLADVAALTESS